MRFQQESQFQRGRSQRGWEQGKAGMKAGTEQSRVQEGVWATQWPFENCKSNLHKVKEQKIQHERGETGSRQGIARNGNKQWTIQVWQEQERLQRNQAALLAPRELKGTIKEDEDTAEE